MKDELLSDLRFTSGKKAVAVATYTLMTTLLVATTAWEQAKNIKPQKPTPKKILPAKQYIIGHGTVPPPILVGPAAEGFELSELQPKTDFHPGDPITITVLLKNTLTTTHTYFAADPEFDFDFNVTDLSDNPMPLTSYARTLAGIIDSRLSHGGPPRTQVVLAPQETRSFTLLVSRRRDMTSSGTYLISATHKVDRLDAGGIVELVSTPTQRPSLSHASASYPVWSSNMSSSTTVVQ